jgi:hypothetical protein
MGRTRQKLPMCRNVGDGETRTRTEDTTIFSEPSPGGYGCRTPANRRLNRRYRGVAPLVSVGFSYVWDSVEGLKSRTPAGDLLGAM